MVVLIAMFAGLQAGNLCLDLDRLPDPAQWPEDNRHDLVELWNVFSANLATGRYDRLIAASANAYLPLIHSTVDGRRLLYFQKYHVHENQLKTRMEALLGAMPEQPLPRQQVSARLDDIYARTGPSGWAPTGGPSPGTRIRWQPSAWPWHPGSPSSPVAPVRAKHRSWSTSCAVWPTRASTPAGSYSGRPPPRGPADDRNHSDQYRFHPAPHGGRYRPWRPQGRHPAQNTGLPQPPARFLLQGRQPLARRRHRGR